MRVKFRNFLLELREYICNFIKFVPEKYRNTPCKRFTTNSVSFWNSPR